MLSEYGDILSGEQVRRILHISKRKCAWMLNNGYIIGLPAPLPDIDVDAFREWLDTEFSCLPDALTVQEVADTTGYNKHSVERWIRNGHLKCVNVQGGVKIVPKA